MAAVTLTFALAAIQPVPVSAASSVTVNTTLDEVQARDGMCSLREATLYANRAEEPDCASVAPSGTTTINLPTDDHILSGGPLSISGNAALAGAGAAATRIDAGGRSAVIEIGRTANVTINGITVTGGNSGSACTNGCIPGSPIVGLPGGGISNAGTLALVHVTVSGNRTGAGNTSCTAAQTSCDGGPGGSGAGISSTGTLTISDSTITGNATGAGGSGTPGRPAALGGMAGNGGNGGAVDNIGTLTISNSTITGNSTGSGGKGGAAGTAAPGRNGLTGRGGGAGGSGAGIENSGRLVIAASTLTGNATGAGGDGGRGGDIDPNSIATGGTGGVGGPGGSGAGIDSATETTISNSTIAGNRAAPDGTSGIGGDPFGHQPPPAQPGSGGGINQSAMGATLTHVTIASNTASGAGGGIAAVGGTITAANSILAANAGSSPSQNCTGVITDQGGNLEFGASSCPAGFLRADPRLAALGDNGGPTQTIALQPGSAAIHHVRTCVLATDQRGVARPVGAPCDSGAYQAAPPSLSGISASAVTTTSATIAAAANPNLKDATVVVRFGTTPSYGSSTSPRDLGAGNAPAPFTAALTGLQPNTTYHFAVVATNGDGQTTSSDGVFTTLPPLTASIADASTLGPTLQLTIACDGGFGPGTCAGPIRLTTRVPGKHHHAVRIEVAASSYAVPTGGRVTVRLVLNRAGQTVLAQHYVLSGTLSVDGTTQLSRGVTFKYGRIKTDIPFTISFAGTSSVATQLTVTGIPQGGKLSVACRGGGCPFAERTFKGRDRVVLAPVFKHAPLRPGATLQFEITAPNRVGFVEKLVIRRSHGPLVIKQCLPPGVHHPTRCVKTR